jgi:hypothetical protein
MLALVAVAVITTGTPTQPFTADAASPGALLQTLVIPNDKPVKVESMPLQAGRWYEIEVIGAFSDWDFRKDGVDAIWRDADKDFRPWEQLRINGKTVSKITGKLLKYNPDHVYRFRMKGEGKPVQFFLIDAQDSWSDNHGSLRIKIYGGKRARASKLKVHVKAFGKDETDGSDVGWNSGYPNPSFDDVPTRRGYPNAVWNGDHWWDGNHLCLAVRNLKAPYPPSHKLAVGYTVTLEGGTFEDGNSTKTFVLHRFSGNPQRSSFQKCVKVITYKRKMSPNAEDSQAINPGSIKYK